MSWFPAGFTPLRILSEAKAFRDLFLLLQQKPLKIGDGISSFLIFILIFLIFTHFLDSQGKRELLSRVLQLPLILFFKICV